MSVNEDSLKSCNAAMPSCSKKESNQIEGNNSNSNIKTLIFKKICFNQGKWNDVEIRKLLEGLIQYRFFRKARKNIQSNIITRNIEQITSTTQKFFYKLKIPVKELIKTQKMSSKQILNLLSNEFLTQCSKYGIADNYRKMFSTHEKEFHMYFRKIYKDMFPTKLSSISISKDDVDIFSIRSLNNDKDISKKNTNSILNSTKVNTFKTDTISISFNHKETSEINTSFIDQDFPCYLNSDLQSCIENAEGVDISLNHENEEKRENQLDINQLRGSFNNTCLFNNLADNLRDYYRKSYPKNKIWEPKKPRKYKKNKESFIELNNNKIKFLNDIGYIRKNQREEQNANKEKYTNIFNTNSYENKYCENNSINSEVDINQTLNENIVEKLNDNQNIKLEFNIDDKLSDAGYYCPISDNIFSSNYINSNNPNNNDDIFFANNNTNTFNINDYEKDYYFT